MQKTRLECAIETLLTESLSGERTVNKRRDPKTGLSYLVVNGKPYNSNEAERRLFNKAFARRRSLFSEQGVTAEGEQFVRAGDVDLEGANADDAILRALAGIIHKHRLSIGMSQQELATRAGFTRTYISDMERGARNMSFINLKRLSDALQVPMWKLVQAVEEKEMADGKPQMEAMMADSFPRRLLPVVLNNLSLG